MQNGRQIMRGMRASWGARASWGMRVTRGMRVTLGMRASRGMRVTRGLRVTLGMRASRGTRALLSLLSIVLLAGCGNVADDDTLEPSTPTATPPTSTPPPASPAPETATPAPASPTPDSPTPDSPTPVSPAPESPTPVSATASPSPTPTMPQTFTCPGGMSPVYLEDPAFPSYCIDTWEDSYSGDPGSPDQYADDAVLPTAVSASMPGVIPGVGVSFDQAAAICRNTPVMSASGALLGYKHLVTSQEWSEAADGQLGPGGTLYPYGDTYDATLCATTDANEQEVYTQLQPTGSFPGCVSDYGVYDQSGNAWEWADPRLSLDVEGWLELAAGYGVSLTEDGEDYLMLEDPTAAALLKVDVVSVQPSTVEIDAGGYLFAQSVQVGPDNYDILKGYLKLVQMSGLDESANYLPVQVIPIEPGSAAKGFHLMLLRQEDGRPIPDKRGGAYYFGNAQTYDNYSSQTYHFHDFSGTIAFRCVCEPIEAP